MKWLSPSVGGDEKTFAVLLASVFAITFSIALGQFLAAICLLLFVAGLVNRHIRLCFPTVMIPAALFMTLAILLSAQGGGVGGLWHRCGKLFWFLLIPVTATLVTGITRERRVLLAFFAGCSVLGIKDLVLFPVLAWQKPLPDYLTAVIDKGSMTDGQMLMLGVVGSSLLILSIIKEGNRVPWWGWCGLALQLGGLLINFKRGSWFCAIILVAVALLPRLRRRSWIMALVILAGFLMLPPVQTRLAQLKREFNVEGGGRLTMWCKITPALIKEAPLGIGYGCLSNDKMRTIFSRVEPARNHLHANWAQVLVETGWAGLVIYLAWMGFGLRDAARYWRRVRTAGSESPAIAFVILLLLAGLLLNGLVEYNFGDTEIIFIYAFVMGLAASGQFPDRLRATPDQQRQG